MKLWLVRHALPLAAEGLCYGASEVRADARATQEAAEALAGAVPEGLVVRSSPLARCMQLAQALETLRPDLVATADPRLAEMDFGAWEGRPWDAIGRAAFDAWMADFAQHRCGGGESVAALMQRVGTALTQARDGGADTLWITHAGVVRAVRLLVRGAALPARASDWPQEGLPFGAWECVDLG